MTLPSYEIAGDTRIRHVDGIAWHDAPKPRRWHRCWPQTEGRVGLLDMVERCPCGAIRHNRGPWFERNQR